jgi:hypothetical protein
MAAPTVTRAPQICEGYELIFCSCFNESNYKSLLRAKLPFQHFQAIQVLQKKEEIGTVIREGFPKDDTDEQLDFLDSLADLL